MNQQTAIDRATGRELGRRMTYTQYQAAESERQRLTGEGQRRELTAAEVGRLRHANTAVVGLPRLRLRPGDGGDLHQEPPRDPQVRPDGPDRATGEPPLTARRAT